MKLEFSRQIFNNAQISDSMKTLPVGAEMFHADRRMVMMKLIVTFRSFGYAPKNVRVKCVSIFIVALPCESQISLFKLTIHD